MNAKISLREIVEQNYSTYKDTSGNTNYSDIVFMFLVPAAIGITAGLVNSNLNAAYGNIVTVGALFAGLLLNLLMLIYDQKSKIVSNEPDCSDPGYEIHAIRKKVINEVHYNISYCVLISLIVVVLSTFGGAVTSWSFTLPIVAYSLDLKNWLINSFLIAVCVHLLFALLMILKRVHKLIAS